MTRPALTKALRIDVEVVTAIRMPLRAVCLQMQLRVLGWSHDLQVRRVDTSLVLAEVVEHLPFGNHPVDVLIEKAVNLMRLPGHLPNGVTGAMMPLVREAAIRDDDLFDHSPDGGIVIRDHPDSHFFTRIAAT